MAVNIQGNQIVSTASKPSIDADYGPYTGSTLQEALNSAESALKYKKSEGKTIGIKVGTSSIIEYWYKFNNNNELSLTEKTPDLSSKQDIITNSNKLDADLVDDANSDNKFVTSSEKTIWNGKQNALTTEQLSNITKGGTALQPSSTSGLLKNDGSVDTETAGKANSAVQPIESATENNFVAFDEDGNIKDSGCNEASFIKGVQQNGVDLTKDANGKVNVTVENGKSAYILWCEENNLDPEDPNTPNIATWLASLKANIGAFQFITPIDTAAEAALTTIGSTYATAIGGVSPTQSTLSIILLMNDSNNTKTMMIVTQDDGNSGFEFVYAGDLQSAMPSNILTQSDIVNSFGGGANKVLSAEAGYLLGQKVNDVDDEPTAGSEKFVKSGGVQNELALGAVYDVSAKNPTAGSNNDGKWESLSALLSDANINTLIPTAYRKGGMSVKFVHSVDNKYVCYMYNGTAVTGTPDPFLDVANWEKMNLEDDVSQLKQEVGNFPSPTILTTNNFINGSLDPNYDYTADNRRLIGTLDLTEYIGKQISIEATSGYEVSVRIISLSQFADPTDINLSGSDILYYNGSWQTVVSTTIMDEAKSAVIVIRRSDNHVISTTEASNVFYATYEVSLKDEVDKHDESIKSINQSLGELSEEVSIVDYRVGSWVVSEDMMPSNLINGSLSPSLDYTSDNNRLIGTVNLEGKNGQTLTFSPAQGIYGSFRFVSSSYVEDPTDINLSPSDIVDYSGNWETELSYKIPSSVKSLVVIFKKLSGTPVSVSDLGATAINVGFGNLVTAVNDILEEIEEIVTPPAPKTSFVWGADLIKRAISVEQLGQISYLQSFCKYNGKYYSTNGSKIAEQKASDFSVLRDVSLNLGHGNSLQLGSSGKAWASGWDNQKMYKVDLNTLTIDETITLPTTGYTTAAVDEVNGLMYIFQRDTYPTTQEPYNFIVYDYINEQVLSTRIIETFDAMQSVDYYQGKILMLNGLGSSAHPSGMRIYNTQGDVLATFELSVFTNTEPEGICFDRDEKVILVSDENLNLYKVQE